MTPEQQNLITVLNQYEATYPQHNYDTGALWTAMGPFIDSNYAVLTTLDQQTKTGAQAAWNYVQHLGSNLQKDPSLPPEPSQADIDKARDIFSGAKAPTSIAQANSKQPPRNQKHA